MFNFNIQRFAVGNPETERISSGEWQRRVSGRQRQCGLQNSRDEGVAFMFEIQRFASDGPRVTSTGDWHKLDEHDSFGYVPAGIEFEASSQVESIQQIESIQRMDKDSLLYAISGISSATGTSDTVTVIASGEISAITVVDSGTVEARYTINVSGGDKTDLTVIIGGTTYAVNSSGKLYIPEPAEDTGTVISTAVVNRLKRANGKIITQNLNYINPNAADSDIVVAITALNSLSQNTKKEIARVNRTVIG